MSMTPPITPHLMNTYGRLPVAFQRGEGVWLWDTEGKRYLDGFSGIAVTGLGHAHPRLVQAIAEQAGRIIHASNWYRIPEQERLADLLCDLSGMDNVFFCNSGCEANEAAIKLARLYGHQKGLEQPTIVVMEKAFHGRTMATLSATGSRKVQAGFEPLLTGFARVPYNDLQALEQVAVNNKNIVAVLVEPIQGEGGINVPDDGYLPHLRRVCDRQGWLLMLDEVQSGVGRTGRWFAHQLLGIRPDVMTLAKGLANGVPIGACLAAGAAARVFHAGNHGSTFGGNPLASVAAYTTLRIIADENLLENAAQIGARIRAQLSESLRGLAGVKEIRGKGLMVGIDLERPCGELVTSALVRGLLINVTMDSVVRLLPPLIMRADEAHQLVEGVSNLVREFLTEPVSVAAQG
ncbi:MAG TPA: aspartate aminotransferase family protein [Burkholderiales bacterium]|nr:aspartate aminotransferase family protein [Burkholderiales bacterium]